MTSRPKWVWIDSDAGVDDAVALCAALKLQKGWGYEMKGVSTSFGNTSADNVNVNVRKVMASCLKDGSGGCPIFAGAQGGLRGETADASYFHGKDGLGDAGLDDPVEVTLDGRGAVEGLVGVAEDAKREGAELIVVTIGPLTNLAEAMMRGGRGGGGGGGGGGWMGGVANLVVMGGCGNAHGNATRVAEFNVKADVTAAAHVFEHWRGEMTVVSWDLCCGNPIPWRSFHEAVSKELHEGEVGKFLKAICRDIYSSEKDADKRSGEGAVICDFLAVAVAIDRAVVRKWEMVNVEVETGGSITEGMTVVDWGCYDGVKGREKNVEWVTAVDMGRVVEMLGMTVKGGGEVCD
ncbi:hypothetical protein TrCOL_g3775 [Triparma columacea]|uniref:Inosine/uridine-preferring nucleoside hydrolase domain-containing protein n=1 Tax=Triparma columacea TaxID=722753 RepID=A0A9W7L6H6_9STRA|nr:hypothetical protein TrCOL_g3775 [Triparma columacea]